MTLVQLAAVTAALLLLGLALFQVALAFGAPIAAYAWGGAQDGGALPPRLRLASAVSALILILIAVLVTVRAGLAYPSMARSGSVVWTAWSVVAFLVLNTIGNLRSKSPKERRVMAPLALLLAGLVACVAASG